MVDSGNMTTFPNGDEVRGSKLLGEVMTDIA
jgi:hypothetical protein